MADTINTAPDGGFPIQGTTTTTPAPLPTPPPIFSPESKEAGVSFAFPSNLAEESVTILGGSTTTTTTPTPTTTTSTTSTTTSTTTTSTTTSTTTPEPTTTTSTTTSTTPEPTTTTSTTTTSTTTPTPEYNLNVNINYVAPTPGQPNNFTNLRTDIQTFTANGNRFDVLVYPDLLEGDEVEVTYGNFNGSYYLNSINNELNLRGAILLEGSYEGTIYVTVKTAVTGNNTTSTTTTSTTSTTTSTTPEPITTTSTTTQKPDETEYTLYIKSITHVPSQDTPSGYIAVNENNYTFIEKTNSFDVVIYDDIERVDGASYNVTLDSFDGTYALTNFREEGGVTIANIRFQGSVEGESGQITIDVFKADSAPPVDDGSTTSTTTSTTTTSTTTTSTTTTTPLPPPILDEVGSNISFEFVGDKVSFRKDNTNGIEFRGAVEGADGFLYLIPYASDNIVKFDISNNTSEFVSLPAGVSGLQKYVGGVLAGNDKIYTGSHSNNPGPLVINSDPGSFSVSEIVFGDGKSDLQARGPSYYNDIVYIPSYSNGRVWRRIDTTTDEFLDSVGWGDLPRTDPVFTERPNWQSEGPNNGILYDSLFGSVAGGNGKIYGMPFGASRINVFDTATNTAYWGSDYISGNAPVATGLFNDIKFHATFLNKYRSGALADTGAIYAHGANARSVLKIDTLDDTATEIPYPDEIVDAMLTHNNGVRVDPESGLIARSAAFSSVKGSDGRIYSVPWGIPYLIWIDPADDSIGYLNIENVLNQDTSDTNNSYFTYGTSIGSNIYLAPGRTDKILKIDLSDVPTSSGVDKVYTLEIVTTKRTLNADGVQISSNSTSEVVTSLDNKFKNYIDIELESLEDRVEVSPVHFNGIAIVAGLNGSSAEILYNGSVTYDNLGYIFIDIEHRQVADTTTSTTTSTTTTSTTTTTSSTPKPPEEEYKLNVVVNYRIPVPGQPNNYTDLSTDVEVFTSPENRFDVNAKTFIKSGDIVEVTYGNFDGTHVLGAVNNEDVIPSVNIRGSVLLAGSYEGTAYVTVFTTIDDGTTSTTTSTTTTSTTTSTTSTTPYPVTTSTTTTSTTTTSTTPYPTKALVCFDEEAPYMAGPWDPPNEGANPHWLKEPGSLLDKLNVTIGNGLPGGRAQDLPGGVDLLNDIDGPLIKVQRGKIIKVEPPKVSSDFNVVTTYKITIQVPEEYNNSPGPIECYLEGYTGGSIVPPLTATSTTGTLPPPVSLPPSTTTQPPVDCELTLQCLTFTTPAGPFNSAKIRQGFIRNLSEFGNRTTLPPVLPLNTGTPAPEEPIIVPVTTPVPTTTTSTTTPDPCPPPCDVPGF